MELPIGSTDMHFFGNGYFYFSENKDDKDGQSYTQRLYKASSKP